MSITQFTRIAAASAVFGALFAFIPNGLAQEIGPHDWLSRMTDAVRSTNYEGTVIRTQNGTTEVLKVMHLVSDDVIREKVIVQEGNGLEIIRNGNEVHCILPDKKSVLVEHWNDQSTLFSTLPTSDFGSSSEYDVAIVRSERVAGRKSVMLAIRPHDNFRFGHQVWLDSQTGFPLQTKLIDDNGESIEQVKFADISIDREIQLSALAPSYSIAEFRWYGQPRKNETRAVETAWSSGNLPPGFRAVSAHEETLPGKDEAVIYILFSDGLANVSVFIEPNSVRNVAQRARVGASSSFSIAVGDVLVTAVGAVPAATVEQIARSMRQHQ